MRDGHWPEAVLGQIRQAYAQTMAGEIEDVLSGRVQAYEGERHFFRARRL